MAFEFLYLQKLLSMINFTFFEILFFIFSLLILSLIVLQQFFKIKSLNQNLTKKRPSFLRLVFGTILFFYSTFSMVGQNACNPGSIYDQMQSAYHTTIALQPDGNFICWGSQISANGTSNNLSPVIISPANGYNYTGTPKFAALGSRGSTNMQAFFMTTSGLYAWGKLGVVVPGAKTTSTAFQQITMPPGVTPAQVSRMEATEKALVILTTSGELWVSSATVDLVGNGTTGAVVGSAYWGRVSIAATSPLTGVLDFKATPRGMMAYTASDKWYTWGTKSFLGDGSAAPATARNFATEMTSPFTGAPKMLAMTSNGGEPSYFAIAPDNTLWALGNNQYGQLGNNNTGIASTATNTAGTKWARVRNPGNTGNLNNVVFISGNNKDGNGAQASIGCFTSDKHLYIWGSDDNGMAGGGTGTSVNLPSHPAGFVFGSDNPLYLEVGGHTSAYIKECADRYCYVGHKYDGSMGDGGSGNNNETSFNCISTPQALLCGASMFDSGDAPLSYEGSNTAAHYYSCPQDMMFGLRPPTSNNNSIVNVAPGTDNMGTNGDGIEEDGISGALPTYTGGGAYSLNLNALNTSGVVGNIYAWIDWNNNGVFESSEYRGISIVSQVGSQAKTLSWTGLPANACGKLYVRIRITKDNLKDDSGTTAVDERSRGLAIGGEVEDYYVEANAGTTTPTPTLGTVTVAPCSTGLGSFKITNYSGAYTYTVTPSDGVSVSGDTVNAPAGTYTVTATLGACVSLASNAITVTASNTSPAPPTATVTAHQTTCNGTGTITVTAPASGANIRYTVTGPTTVGPQASNSFAGLAPGVYDVTTTNTLTNCTSLPLQLIINSYYSSYILRETLQL